MVHAQSCFSRQNPYESRQWVIERGGLTFPGMRRTREVPSLLEQSGYGSLTMTLCYGPPFRSQTTLGGGVWE